jgi:amino-acid N-acetyltransferase
LLVDAGLPIDDLRPELLEHFLLAERDGEIVGIAGIEAYATTGLLRSVVVAGNSRGAGLGKKLVGALELAAQAAGIVDLWLLTIDAERFFARLGYDIVSRDSVPDAIRSSKEFAVLCPESAHLMTKKLVAVKVER